MAQVEHDLKVGSRLAVRFAAYPTLNLPSFPPQWRGGKEVGPYYGLMFGFMWKGWVTTPTHHNMHHQFSRCNFGLYWGGWDQIFRTLHPKTREEFYRIKDQA